MGNAPLLSPAAVVVTKSTVPVATGGEIERILRGERPKAQMQVVSNPEFMREGAAPEDLARVVVDTTVQPKAVMFPTDAKLLNRARERLVRLAAHVGVELRQSYARVGKLALIKHQRYAHAHQFKRANRSLRRLKTAASSATSGDASTPAAEPLPARAGARSTSTRTQSLYSLHAPEVECTGKGKAHRPYEFGVKVSIGTTAHRSKGGQFEPLSRAILMTVTRWLPSFPPWRT